MRFLKIIALISVLSPSVLQAQTRDAIKSLFAITHLLLSETDNSVKCWGRNLSGQLGNGNTSNSSVPVPVLGL